MKHIRHIIILSFLSIITLQLSLAAPPDDFSKGIELYKSGAYQEALDVWLGLYNSGQRSAALAYNIGNAYFKLNNVPGSVLFYERAHLLKPADEDIVYNLQIARANTVDKFAEIPELFFKTWYDLVSLTMRTNTWAVISLTSFIFFLFLLSLYLYTRNYRLKILGFWLALFFVFLATFSVLFAVHSNKLVRHNPQGIIMVPQVNGKSSPDNSGTDLFLIHEGTKVTVLEKVGDWYEIRLSDGNKGWVEANSVEKL